MKKKNILLIIGNGFDLELGLKTSYKNFIESDIYDSYSKIISKKLEIQKTFDISYDEELISSNISRIYLVFKIG